MLGDAQVALDNNNSDLILAWLKRAKKACRELCIAFSLA